MFVEYNNKAIELVDNGGRPLLNGRAFIGELNGKDINKEFLVSDLAVNLVAIRDWVASKFIGRNELADAMAVALACGEHLFVYGPPGTAKSSLLRLFAEGIGGKFWRIVLNPDTSREDILGALDPDALSKGLWQRNWASLAKADLAFLDEIWKASPQVVNILLDALEERKAVSGDNEIDIPLLSAVAASNEIPDNRESMAAYDRFLLRLSVGYLRDANDFQNMLTSVAGTTARNNMAGICQADWIRLLAASSEVMALNPPKSMVEALTEIWHELSSQGKQISDRRWRKTLKAAMAMALLENEKPSSQHLAVGRWTLWSEADEEKDIKNVILAMTDPLANEILNLESLLSDLIAQDKKDVNLTGRDKMLAKAEVAMKANKLLRECDNLKPTGNYEQRINQIKSKAKQIVDNMLNMEGF